jgi:hypothetical protein
MPFDTTLPCSEQSLAAREPIHGTALAEVEVWLLLEVGAKWEADIADTPLPPETRAWLDKLGTELPKSRLLFIRRDRPSRNLSFYVAVTAPQRAVYRFYAMTYEELANLDVARVVREGAAAAEELGGEKSKPLYLVCTHGKRDACCARKGVTLYRALEQVDLDGDLWQSSHQGGHRFAANLLYLPFGVHYGRLDSGDVKGLLAAHGSGRIFDLERYRGLSQLSLPHQATEAWLREQIDEMRLDGLERLDHGEVEPAEGEAPPRDDDDLYFACFRTRDGSEHRVVVAEREGKQKRLASCGADNPTPFAYYDVVRYESATRGSRKPATRG